MPCTGTSIRRRMRHRVEQLSEHVLLVLKGGGVLALLPEGRVVLVIGALMVEVTPPPMVRRIRVGRTTRPPPTTSKMRRTAEASGAVVTSPLRHEKQLWDWPSLAFASLLPRKWLRQWRGWRVSVWSHTARRL